MNTGSLKTFAQTTRNKLISLISAKLDNLLDEDSSEYRAYAPQISKLRDEIRKRGKEIVIEEVAYTWFNRIMALRYMDANGYNSPKVVSPVEGGRRPEILQEAMAGNIDASYKIEDPHKLPEEELYRKLLISVCNSLYAPMPFLFEKITDYTELLLPNDLLSEQSFITDIRKGMTDEDCKNVEIVGWLYQFYITDRKADSEKKKSRRGGLKSDEQAAATQLFTPHWIVRYMVENSLGRIWMTLHPESSLIDSMKYYIKPVEGEKDVIPEHIKSAKDIKFLDPCMGSGHILVYAFDLFTKMYEEEGEMSKDIPGLILENNLYGMDIDKRCYQLTSFALTMKAREYYRRYLRNTVQPHVIALQNIPHDVIESSGKWSKDSLIWKFEDIDTIGSLLKVTPKEFSEIKVDSGVFGQDQKLLKTQAEYLSRSYDCIVTNPPYLGKGMGDVLKIYILREYPNSKTDTMATFMERNIDFSFQNGKISMINMQTWMFLVSYYELRNNILFHYQVDSLLHLGPHAFNEISGEKVQTTTFVLANHKPFFPGIYFRLTDESNSEEKEKTFLLNEEMYIVEDQTLFDGYPEGAMGYWADNKYLRIFKDSKPISQYALPKQGISTCDVSRFVKHWYEVNLNKSNIFVPNNTFWVKYNNGGEFRRWYGNRTHVVLWHFNGDYLKENNAALRNQSFYYKSFLAWNKIASGGSGFRYFEENFLFDGAGGSLFPKNNTNVEYILSFLNSKVSKKCLSILSPSYNNNEAHVGSLPFIIDEDKKNKIENFAKNNIKISKKDWDAHETSWDFQENELLRIKNEDLRIKTIQEASEEYKDYWTEKFKQLHQNEEELNGLFIEIYELQDELAPDIPLDEVTILQKGEISIKDNKIVWHEDEIIKQFLHYLVGLFMGRFSVDKPGLIIASQGQKIQDLDLPAQTIEIDDDGIIPIIMEPDFFANDLTKRIEDAIKTLFEKDGYYENLKFIENTLGMTLREWLFKNLYDKHLEMYSVKGAKRPIYWLFSSRMGERNKKGHFKALVYMHRLESDTLSKLHADYVLPYQANVQRQLTEAEEQADRNDLSPQKHRQALAEVENLKQKLREVKEFSEELAKMASRRMTIDLDDGVKTNYPKFYPLVEPIKGLETSGE